MQMQTRACEREDREPCCRERKKIATRDGIVRASMELFERKGFEAVTAEEIALRAGVSRRSFFRYFPAKELVVFPHQAAYLDLFRSLLAQGADTDPPFPRVRRACLVLAREYMNAREEHLAQQRIIQASPSLIARGEAFDTEWEEAISGVFIEDGAPAEARRRARFLAGAILGVIRAALKEWYAAGCRKDLVRLGGEALRLVEFGAASGSRQRVDRAAPRL